MHLNIEKRLTELVGDAGDLRADDGADDVSERDECGANPALNKHGDEDLAAAEWAAKEKLQRAALTFARERANGEARAQDAEEGDRDRVNKADGDRARQGGEVPSRGATRLLRK